MTSLKVVARAHREIALSSLPERIVLCVDLELGSSSATSGAGSDRSKLDVAIAALSTFVRAKLSLASPTQLQARVHVRPNEFAVGVIHPQSGARLVSSFSSDVDSVLPILEGLKNLADLEESQGGSQPLDLSQLLDTMKKYLDPSPHFTNILRLICVYGNSSVVPVFSSGGVASHMEILAHPGFVFDLLYLHDDLRDRGQSIVRDIYYKFGELKLKGDGYFFHKCPSFFFARHQLGSSLHMAVAMLLQHPAMRQEQPRNFASLESLLCVGKDLPSETVHDASSPGPPL